uniref:Uncharacterized protein n=2 Tax=Craspedostauros australis TaxID=1486917 RepID=A0A7R9WQL4_9STRA|mmetsp:Transcript_16027/g.44384  ORF Transcript_16027/g.44384 Transcript_16027/m.44384 type:complete len:340 (+) Transcript_16027:154-1173(+)|eukprot:CAMPEP_0198129248 /NCGR_PEP_ID=MMETSP1442-20131203/51269_1 /TAXON_ID= /ORGANISM="Craspedostauros australis, Strain CCMP3328" /LENGTH=339 /DNA_ID=CAMNT_0043789611 /DNA_START=96 /DNA_END=1115 /DNA_ORIENTATION=+
MISWKVAEVAALWTKTIATFVLLHRLFVAKNAQGISRKTQEILLVVYLLRYGHIEQLFFKDFEFHGWNAYGTLLSLFLALSTFCAIAVMTPWMQHPVYKTYRAEQDDFPHWLFLLVPSICLGLDRWMSHDQPQMVFQDTASILESFALLPQIQMYRKFRHVESFTSGTYIFLIGLHHTIGSVFWVYAGLMFPGGISNIRLNCLTQTAMVLFCVIGTCSAGSATTTAPFMPQLKKFTASVCSPKFVLAVCAVFALETRVTRYAISDLEKLIVTSGTMAACGFLVLLTLRHCFVVRRRRKQRKHTPDERSIDDADGDEESTEEIDTLWDESMKKLRNMQVV